MSQPNSRSIDDPAADAALLLFRLGLIVLAFAVPLSAVASRRAVFTLLPIGAGLLLLATTLLPRPPIRRRLGQAFSTAAGLGGLVLFVWSAASILWTPFPAEAGLRWLKEGGTIAAVALVMAVLPERTRTSNLYLFPLGLVPAGIATAVFGLVGAQRLSLFPDADATLVRAVVSLVVLVWPALGALAVRERWTSAALLVIGITLAAMAAWTPVALTALALGAVAFAGATLSPRNAGMLFGVVAGAVLLFAPVIPFVFGPAFARLGATTGGSVPEFGEMARALATWASLVASDPMHLVTGHGLDLATRGAVVGYLPPEIPRSLAFELWYDLGVVGAVAASMVAFGGFVLAGRTSVAVAPFLLAEIVSGLTFALWGLDTTELWWVTTLSVGALAFAVVIRGQYRTERPVVQMASDAALPEQRRATTRP